MGEGKSQNKTGVGEGELASTPSTTPKRIHLPRTQINAELNANQTPGNIMSVRAQHHENRDVSKEPRGGRKECRDCTLAAAFADKKEVWEMVSQQHDSKAQLAVQQRGRRERRQGATMI
eukprot:scaffold113257_cov26-Tisochrysis_lutea.AAC.3